MVRLSSFLVAVLLFPAFCSVTIEAKAQQDFVGYNEESVGVMNYNDSEAAGESSVPADEAADEVVSEASSADADVATATEGDASGSVTTPEVAADTAMGAEVGVGGGDVSANATVAAAGGTAAGDDADQNQDGEVLLAGAAAKGDSGEETRADRLDWEWGAIRHYMSWTSTSGLMDLKEAGSNEWGTIAMGIYAGFFKYSDYLEKGDTNVAMAGTLNIRAVVWKYLEVHTAIRTYANHNNMEYPQLFQTIGDLELGVKGFYSFNELVTAGLDVGFNVLNSVGEVGMDWSGTSVGFDGLLTLDFAALNERIPLRTHLMVGYLFDNASNIIEDVEKAGGGCGTDSDGDGEVEFAGCLSPIERTALGIDRNDQFHLGVGADASFPYISPILEYHIDIPVNRQGFTCPQIPNSYDSCMADAGAKAMRQWMNVGVRVLPPVKGLALDAGVEIGLAGYAPSVHELAAQEPYMVKFGLSYQLNPFEEPPKCEPVEKIVEVPVQEEEAPAAQIVGMVHDSESAEMPVADAVIVYEGIELNPQVTSAAGRFNSYELPAGDVSLRVSAPGYEEQQFLVTLPETGFVEQLFPLVRKPMMGVVTVTVVDEKGEPVPEMEVQVGGMTTGTHTTDVDGNVRLDTEAGMLTFVVSNEKYVYKQISVEVQPEAHAKATMELKKKGKTALAEVKKDIIRIRRKVHFQTDSDVLTENSYALLDEVADVLMKNPQIRGVEIQGHTDDRGNRDHNVELSQKRAEAVRQYLINAGVEGERLEAKGYGPARPIAPNVINTGRAKNRRVEFHIIQSE